MTILATYIICMCGRVTQISCILPDLKSILGDEHDSCVKDAGEYILYNGAPSQVFWIIRQHPENGALHRDRMTWV